ncbi:TadE/TadG family type IV pilus assembly protein [Nocardioides piscis]|uniref:Pilus assembly protein n=1 Tax=Nocardioides piscis TaxID=2714938 RepID=A0A6G7YJF0_9ACTN|nr:TadE/TadG family type IV pilus assembly protein [Nocardioides piscis]QIK76874.1 pilus assembly protein [Nocardioides piscis]
MSTQTRGRHRDDRGAAAVEFALVAPILVALLLGMVDYGLFFADAIGMRQGIRENARKAVVSDFVVSPACNSGGDLDKIRCQTKADIIAFSGTAQVKITAPSGWVKGEPLTVCAVIANPGVTKFVPMPSEITSKVEMAIETQSLPPSGTMTSTDAGVTC